MRNEMIARVQRAAFLGAAVVPLLLGLAASACAQGVAMVTDLQGKATMASADGRPRDVTILADLAAGAKVQLGAGATMVALYLEAGDEYVFKGPASIVFKAALPEVTSGAKPEKRSPSLGAGGKSVRIKPVGVVQGALVMRGFRTGARIQLFNLHKTRTLETQPEFRWLELQPGVRYQFELADDTGRAVYESQVDSTTFKLPASVALTEGVAYTWEVSARAPDGKKFSGTGEFAVAPADLRTQAAALRPAVSAPLSSRIAYAAWLDQMELKDEARKYWKTAAAERPEDPRLKALASE